MAMNTPKADFGTVEMVSVEWAMKNLVDSIDGFGIDGGVDFGSMLYKKATDRHFGNLIHTIVNNGFRVPVCFYYDRHHDGWALGNGHHRMSAAILLCLDQIPVFWSQGDYMSDEYTDTEKLSTTGDDTLGDWLDSELSDLAERSHCEECDTTHSCCHECG